MKNKNKGYEDKDMGMESILANIAALSGLGVKVGIVESKGKKKGKKIDGPTIAEYATWNEYGVAGKKEKWKIPPRPFIRGYVDKYQEKINSEKISVFRQVSDGKMDANDAIKDLGQKTKEGIKRYIKTSANFEPNKESTKNKKEGRSRPLVDTGALRNAVDYEVVKKE